MIFLAAFFMAQFRAHALYQPGQVVTNDFSFIARKPFARPDGTTVAPGGRVYLHDFAARIVFLEWFAVWCPFCVAAAPQVEAGIAEWYESRGGNPFGAPVLHVAVNQEASSFYQRQTDNFIERQGFGAVVNDYEGSIVNPVRFMFQSSGQPIFVAINGVTNSPSHRPWEVLVNYLGYGQTDFNQTLASFRAKIDAVQLSVAQPQLSTPRRSGADFEFQLAGMPNSTYRVQVSGDLEIWETLGAVAGSSHPVVFRHTNAPPGISFYRAVTP